MPTLTFEIWECPDSGSFECSQVTEEMDQLRARIEPNARRLSSFEASSELESGQLFHDYMGYGNYDLGEIPNRYFTADEEADQQKYLARRAL